MHTQANSLLRTISQHLHIHEFNIVINLNQNIAAPLLDIVWFFACVYCSNNDYILQMKMEAIQGPTVCSSSQMLTSRL